MTLRQVTVFPDIESLNVGTAEWLETACGEAVASRGRCMLALSGGSTPQVLYRLLATESWQKRFDWSRMEVFQVDERMVPVDDPENNFGMIERELLHAVHIPETNIHRIQTELGAKGAAEDYELQLHRSFGAGDIPKFDVLLLGMGEDGHTASLFPGSIALREKRRMVFGYEVEKLNAARITLTFPVINNARKVLFLVAGQKKTAMLRRILQGENAETIYPAAMVAPASGLLYWHLDSEAAAMLHIGISE